MATAIGALSRKEQGSKAKQARAARPHFDLTFLTHVLLLGDRILVVAQVKKRVAPVLQISDARRRKKDRYEPRILGATHLRTTIVVANGGFDYGGCQHDTRKPSTIDEATFKLAFQDVGALIKTHLPTSCMDRASFDQSELSAPSAPGFLVDWNGHLDVRTPVPLHRQTNPVCKLRTWQSI